MVDNDSSLPHNEAMRWGGVEFTNGKKPGVRGAPTEADALIDRAACHRGVAATRRSQLLEAFATRTLSHSHSRGSGNLLDWGGEEILSAAIIVGEPNPLVGGVHDRMPVMLLPEDYDTWLGPSKSPDELRALLRPYDAILMEAYAVSRAVNSVKNDTEECIEPIDDEVACTEGTK